MSCTVCKRHSAWQFLGSGALQTGHWKDWGGIRTPISHWDPVNVSMPSTGSRYVAQHGIQEPHDLITAFPDLVLCALATSSYVTFHLCSAWNSLSLHLIFLLFYNPKLRHPPEAFRVTFSFRSDHWNWIRHFLYAHLYYSIHCSIYTSLVQYLFPPPDCELLKSGVTSCSLPHFLSAIQRTKPKT